MSGCEENIYEDNYVDFPDAPVTPPRITEQETKFEKPSTKEFTTTNVAPRQPIQPPLAPAMSSSKNRRLRVALVCGAGLLLLAAVVMSAYALAKYTQNDGTTKTNESETRGREMEVMNNKNGTCDDNPCQNNGKCVKIIQAGYYCLCDYEKYYGRHCEKALDQRETFLFPHSCQYIKQNDPKAKSGIYLIQVLETNRRFPVYCDQETEGGGWTLVWRYGFTNYDFFNDVTNAVTPVPFWNVVSAIHLVSDVEASSTPPLGETERGAVDFSFWRKIGSEFMVKSNINNWIKCIPSVGSLVEMKNGAISCEIIKTVENCSSNPTPPRPVLLVVANQYSGPLLCSTTSNNANYYYYYWVGSTTKLFPIHDPCGRSGQNQKKNVPDPYGAMYIR